ncbi:MAG: 4-vinyl reductase [Firmicutes bacterium]|nr:4-vinyl reductase [Bacillota bacterium]
MTIDKDIKNKAISFRRVINVLYLCLSEMARRMPFGGEYWVEQITQAVGSKTFKDFQDRIEFASDNPLDICQTYLSFLDSEGFLDANDYSLKDDKDSIHITIQQKKCIYKLFCNRARAEELYFNCPRIGAFLGVLKSRLGIDFGSTVAFKGEICEGKVFPRDWSKHQIVVREGNVLKIAGERAIFLPLQTFTSLLTAIKEHAPHILRQVLYDAGYSSGLIIAQRASSLYNNVQECLESLCEEITRSGLGKVELVCFNQTEGRVVFRCYESFQVAAVESQIRLYRTPRVVCDLLRGTFAAYITVLLGREMICEEMQCQSMKSQYCEFLVLPIAI